MKTAIETLLLSVVAFLLCGCAKPRQAYTVWLGSTQLNQTGTVLDVEIRWPTLYIPYLVLRPWQDTNNFLRGNDTIMMPKGDLKELTLNLLFHNLEGDTRHTQILSNIIWNCLGYWSCLYEPLPCKPGERCRVQMTVLHAAGDTNLFALHAWVVPGPKKWWLSQFDIPLSIITTHCAQVSAPVGEYPVPYGY
jgi:hypothetical protein